MKAPLVVTAALTLAHTAPLASQTARVPQTRDERAVLETVQRTFDAMRTKDTAAMRSLFDSSARIVTTRTRDGAVAVRATPIDRFIAAVGGAKEELNERIWNSEVRVDDNMATVWTPYDFHAGGKFSHCGVDSIQLVRSGTGWKIIHVVDTQRTDRCGNPPPR